MFKSYETPKFVVYGSSFDFVPILGDAVIPRKGKTHGLKIFHRFHFASALKRMSVIAGHTPAGSVDTEYIATVKGAPETLRNMVSIHYCCLPDDGLYFELCCWHP